MRVQRSQRYEYLQEKYKEFDDELVQVLKMLELLPDTDDDSYYGTSIDTLLCDHLQIDTEKRKFVYLAFIFDCIFGKLPSSYDKKVLSQLYLIGDFDCPECGGELFIFDGEYSFNQHDYDSEPYEDVVLESKKCKHCGYETSNEPNNDW